MLLTAASQVHQILAQIPAPSDSRGPGELPRRGSADGTDGVHLGLGRSVSSAGERQTANVNSLDVAALPKRAETFGGFDATTQKG